MHTKDRLAEALLLADLPDMAVKAREGYYDDFLSTLDLPINTLVADLESANTKSARALRNRVVNGEFDGTNEEAEAWRNSSDGKETLSKLLRK